MADLSGTNALEIRAPLARCYAIAADIERAPEWQGVMESAHVLEVDERGRPAIVATEIDASVTTVRLQLAFAYDEPGAITWRRHAGDLKSLHGSWSFEELDAGLTRATYSLEIGLNRTLSLVRRTLKGPVESRIRTLLTHRPLEGLRERAEAAPA